MASVNKSATSIAWQRSKRGDLSILYYRKSLRISYPRALFRFARRRSISTALRTPRPSPAPCRRLRRQPQRTKKPSEQTENRVRSMAEPGFIVLLNSQRFKRRVMRISYAVECEDNPPLYRAASQPPVSSNRVLHSILPIHGRTQQDRGCFGTLRATFPNQRPSKGK